MLGWKSRKTRKEDLDRLRESPGVRSPRVSKDCFGHTPRGCNERIHDASLLQSQATDTTRLNLYAWLGVREYFVFDPEYKLQPPLRAFRLHGADL